VWSEARIGPSDKIAVAHLAPVTMANKAAATMSGLVRTNTTTLHQSNASAVLVYKRHHALGCGYSWKLYNRFDRVTPVTDGLDALTRSLHAECFGMFRKRKRLPSARHGARSDAPLQHPANAQRTHGATARWMCKGCGTTDVTKLSFGPDASMVCDCGIVAPDQTAGTSQRRERNCDEDKDKTTRGDYIQRDARAGQFDEGPESAAQKRARHLQDAQGSRPPPHADGGGLRYAQWLVDKEAARACAAGENGILSDKEVVKKRRMLEQVENLLMQLAPVDMQVAREIRRTVSFAITSAAHHNSACDEVTCRMRLANRHAVIVAAAAFEVTINRMLKAETTQSSLLHSRLAQLRDRMRRNVCFTSQTSVTQRGATRAALEALLAAGSEVQTRCEPCRTSAHAARGVCPPAHTTPATPATLATLATAATPATPAAPCTSGAMPRGDTERVKIRDAVVAVFTLYRSSLPIAVRDGACQMVETQNVMGNATCISVFNDLPASAIAYALLNAVARAYHERGRKDRPTRTSISAGAAASHTADLDAAIAVRCGIAESHAEQLVCTLSNLVPDNVCAVRHAGMRDDDLFK